MNTTRIGPAVWVLRQRRGWLQDDLARAADTSQDTISRVERGVVARIQLETLDTIVKALDASLFVEIRSPGAALDRLLDERHAALQGVFATRLEKLGWAVAPEVSYAHFGERGSIDLLAWHPASHVVLIVEVKTELGSLEATLRKLDEKARLSAIVARDRFAARPSATGRLLVLPDLATARRHVAAHQAILGKALPARGATITSWLRSPSAGLAGLLFVHVPRDARSGLPRMRVRRRARERRPRHSEAGSPELADGSTRTAGIDETRQAPANEADEAVRE